MGLSASARRTLVLSVAVLVVAFAVILQFGPGGPFVTRAFDDIGEAIAASLGAVACWWRARGCHGRARLSWILLSGATGSWAAGELIWSYYELVSSRETPFPSFADLGFLLFPVLALPGLLVRPSAAFSGRGGYASCWTASWSRRRCSL